ncbi:lipoprotein [Spiroplasma tabanidicola]|uniref:Lipoprotein n=1 Tax=Spiroplasma tabanidicola TaxID=324079 RepID=A0A6I6C5Q9_9MOLU|nr:lipoprotein [Spiroplasma tabanidicola]QGS51470.1 hypothetical protein STABA_v1c01030 [Spiroplasma tabanidicola]
MKKLLIILGAMGLVATSSSVAIACNKENNSSEKTDLSTLPIKELGTINGAEDKPTLEDLVKAINNVNSNYNLSIGEVSYDGQPTLSKARLKASTNAKKFKGTVDITYTFKKEESQTPGSTVENLTYAQSKSKVDVINLFKNENYNLINDQNKWTKNYADTEASKIEDDNNILNYGAYQGSLIDSEKITEENKTRENEHNVFNEIKVFFNQSKDLNHLNQDAKQAYIFTAKANAEDSKFIIFLIEAKWTVENEKSKTTTNFVFTTLNQLEIIIS